MKPLKIVIKGGKPLSGRVAISGAKNAALPCLAASILSPATCHLSNVPRVEDIHNLLLALQEVGAEFDWQDSSLSLRLQEIKSEVVSRQITSATRASILLLGPLTARHGYAKIAFPGGCSIGERKIDHHLAGLQRMGATIEIEGDFVIARAKKLRGVEYRFPTKTVTGTENLLMAAALAEGTTILDNCAQEPEIADLARLLQKMGVAISGIGGEKLTIAGRQELPGATHAIIPDRIEAGTYLLAACYPGNRVVLDNGSPAHLQALFNVLEAMGIVSIISGNELAVQENGNLHPVSLCTEPYPGFPTDLQAQLTTLLTQIEGESRIRETIFNDRFKHVHELNRLGADIAIRGDTAVVRGRTLLKGTTITTTDLRASAALVLGGLIAKGETIIENAFQLMRGYELMPEKLRQLGADIRIVR